MSIFRWGRNRRRLINDGLISLDGGGPGGGGLITERGFVIEQNNVQLFSPLFVPQN